VPKGYLAVYVGEDQKNRFIIPISYLNQPLFQELLNQAGYDHRVGGLTIPAEKIFLLMSSLCSNRASQQFCIVELRRVVLCTDFFTQNKSAAFYLL
ncbi:glutamate N-acetyltransferase, partial [Turnera subulata]